MTETNGTNSSFNQDVKNGEENSKKNTNKNPGINRRQK